MWNIELRTALEVEAARLALERGDGRLPDAVRAATDVLVAERLVAAHAALAVETRLFLVQLRPAWSTERMAEDHAGLAAALEAEGADVLRGHLGGAADAVLGELHVTRRRT